MAGDEPNLFVKEMTSDDIVVRNGVPSENKVIDTSLIHPNDDKTCVTQVQKVKRDSQQQLKNQAWLKVSTGEIRSVKNSTVCHVIEADTKTLSHIFT